MNERIKLMREALGFSQTALANKLSITRSAICKLESGENKPSDQTIALICKECNVSEEWLIYGIGDMFKPKSKNDEISKLFGDVLKENDSNFKRRLVKALATLDDDGWSCLENLIDEISSRE